MRGIRQRLTYANVMATIAVFIALGGSSYAALKLPKNSVGNKQIKKNAVTGSKVKNGALTSSDVKTGQFLKPGDADAKYLGKTASAASAAFAASATNAANAANADKLDGIDSSSFARGGLAGAVVDLTSPATADRSIPRIGTVHFDCATTGLSVLIVNHSGYTLRIADAGGLSSAGDGNGVGLVTASTPAPGDEAFEVSPVELVAPLSASSPVPAGSLRAFASATRGPTGPTNCNGAFAPSFGP